MNVRLAMWTAALYAGAVAGVTSLVLLMRLNPDIEPTARTFWVGVPLWLTWGAFMIGIPLGVGAWLVGRTFHARGWGVPEGTVALLAIAFGLAAALSWVNAEIHPEFLHETSRRQLQQDAVIWALAAVIAPLLLRWCRHRNRRRRAAALLLPLAIVLPVARLVGEPTAFFTPLEVEVQPLGHSDRPLMVCGIEGLDPSLLIAHTGGRDLGHFEHLMADGAWGPVRPFKPFLDQAHWTTLATGTLPRTHGVMFRRGWQYPAAFDGTLRLLPWTPQGSRLFLAWDRGVHGVPPPSAVPPLWQRMAFSKTSTTVLDWPGIWNDGAGVRSLRTEAGSWDTGHTLESSLGSILVQHFPDEAPVLLQTLHRDEARIEQAVLALDAGRENVWLSLHSLAVGRRLLEPHGRGDTRRREALALILEMMNDRVGRLLRHTPVNTLTAFVSPYGLAGPDSLERMQRLLGIGSNWRASAESCPDGILFLSGPGVVRGRRLAPVRLQDFTPTLCYLQNLPVAQYMDGRVVLESVDPAWVASHPLRVVE